MNLDSQKQCIESDIQSTALHNDAKVACWNTYVKVDMNCFCTSKMGCMAMVTWARKLEYSS